MNKWSLSLAALISVTTMVESASAYEYYPVRGLRPIVRGIPPIYRPPFRGIVIGRPVRPIYGRVIYGRVIYRPGRPNFPRGVPVYRPGIQY